MRKYLISIVFALLIAGNINGERKLGFYHTSMAFVESLVKQEQRIVDLLSNYLEQNETRFPSVIKYVKEWKSFGPPGQFVRNPLNVYHLFKRILFRFPALCEDHWSGDSLPEEMKKIKREAKLKPSEEDLNGVALSLVHLQDVYELPMDDLVHGWIKDSRSIQGLDADDCLRLGEEGFANMAFNSSELWTQMAVTILEAVEPTTQLLEGRIQSARNLITKRKMMQELITTIVRKADDKVYNKFAGLGVPKSFEKQVFKNQDTSKAMELVDQTYRSLCRSDALVASKDPRISTCYYASRLGYGRTFADYKTERVSINPDIYIHYDVIKEEEIEGLKTISMPHLKTAQVKPYSDITNRPSIARIGKSAWLKKSNFPLVANLLKRVEHLTGLTTSYAEDLHVLNYGVGGHYDLHFDFYDFANRISTKDAKKYKGDQVATILFYLNDVDYGGSTVFPLANIGVKPRKGSVIVWYNLYRNGRGNLQTLHASCPVLLGQKWIGTLWLNEMGQEFLRPCLLDPHR